jgi:hypothetical protein
MDIISLIAILAVMAAPLALLAGWLVRDGYRGLGAFVDRGEPDAFWRATMPWPRGVQEEDGVTWRIPDPEAANAAGAPGKRDPDALTIPPMRPQARVGLRSSALVRRPHR